MLRLLGSLRGLRVQLLLFNPTELAHEGHFGLMGLQGTVLQITLPLQEQV